MALLMLRVKPRLAELALSRPAFNAALERLAQQLQGVSTFEDLKRVNADRVRATHAAGGTSGT